MDWCIGTIAKARNRHVDVEPDQRSTRDKKIDVIWG